MINSINIFIINCFYLPRHGLTSSFNPPLFQPTECLNNWAHRIITHLNRYDLWLEEHVPNSLIQEKADKIGRFIQSQLTPFQEFNTWLNESGNGNLIQQLAVYLAKLPMRAVRNIVQLLYRVLEGCMTGVVHPLQSLSHLARLMISLLQALTEPQLWSKMGVGMLGTSFGQSLVTGNPISIIGCLIGSALVVSGLTVGALQTELSTHLQALPEAALTGFFMGLMVGSIQRRLYQQEIKTYRISSAEEAKKFADAFIQEQKMTFYSSIEWDASGKVVIRWQNLHFNTLKNARPDLVPQPTAFEEILDLKIVINPEAYQLHLRVLAYPQTPYWHIFNKTIPMGKSYPLPPENIPLSQYGCGVGLVQRN